MCSTNLAVRWLVVGSVWCVHTHYASLVWSTHGVVYAYSRMRSHMFVRKARSKCALSSAPVLYTSLVLDLIPWSAAYESEQ